MSSKKQTEKQTKRQEDPQKEIKPPDSKIDRAKRVCWAIAFLILAAAVLGSLWLREYRLHEWIAAAPRSELQSFVAANPDRPDALLRLGVLYRNSGDTSGSAKLLQHAVEVAPGDEANWVELSRTLNDDQDIIQKLEGFLKIVPDSAQIMAELARRKLQIGDSATAASLAHKATEIAPDLPDAQRVLGDVASASGNWPLAESQYEKALSLRDDPDTRLALARIWIPLQRYAEIIDICSPIVRSRESVNISVEQRARALVYTAGARLYEPLSASEIGQLQQQLREADALSERMPQSERFLPPYFMGESLLRSGKPKEAIPFLERSTALAPMFAGSLYSLARAYRLAGETAKAVIAQARHEQLSMHLTELEKPHHTPLTHHRQQ